jgi:hypothetical protein
MAEGYRVGMGTQGGDDLLVGVDQLGYQKRVLENIQKSSLVN